MLKLLALAAFLLKVAGQHVTSTGHLTVLYGEDANLTCANPDVKGVLQVTWQKLFEDKPAENLAAYSKQFGQTINTPYQRKLLFTETSLSSISITLKNITWEDEGCYVCSFNVFPLGPNVSNKTCITVQGISEAKTNVHSHSTEPEGATEVVFSCSATGKPVPVIEWAFSAGASVLTEPPTTTITNGDHTFTSSRNLSLQVPDGWRGNVDCLLKSEVMEQQRKQIPFTVAPEKKEKGKRLLALWVSLVACTLILVPCIIFTFRKRKKLCSRDKVLAWNFHY